MNTRLAVFLGVLAVVLAELDVSNEVTSGHTSRESSTQDIASRNTTTLSSTPDRTNEERPGNATIESSTPDRTNENISGNNTVSSTPDVVNEENSVNTTIGSSTPDVTNEHSGNTTVVSSTPDVTNEDSGNTTVVPSEPEVTTMSTNDAQEKLIWAEEFDTLNPDTWTHLVTAWDGGNREFQYYRNDRKNSFVANGILNIRPTPTVDEYSESFLENGTLEYSDCTMQPCASVGGDDIVSPYFSARLLSTNGFSVKYGRIEIRAKMPRGDWLWPAIWMLPESWQYGGWPRSGEIDIVEVRCNPDLKDPNGHQHGYSEAGSTLHFGPSPQVKSMAGGVTHAIPGRNFSDDFYTYELTWTKDSFLFTVDGRIINEVIIPDGGFTELGGFTEDIYKNGNKDAPFDKRFHFLLNVAVGGNYFPEDWTSDGRRRPYDYSRKDPKKQFWNSRPSWIHTWGQNPEDHSMQIDYIRVYQRDGQGGSYAVGRD